MASRIRRPFRAAPRHRRERPAHTAAYLEGEHGFTPRHCAGTSCMHDHAEDRVTWSNFEQVSA